MVGIYRITNPVGKVYIGQSVNIERRFRSYKNLTHCSQQHKLFRSFRKYNVVEHVFEVIEECNEKHLNERERYWQDFYDVLSNNGLNLKLTKTADRSGKMSKESVEKRVRNTNQKIKVANTNYKLISEKRVANTDFKARTLNTDYKKRTLNTDYQKRTTNTNYKVKVENTDYDKRSEKFHKPVLQITKDGHSVKEWKSIKEVGETLGIDRTSISRCCKGTQKSAGGYCWRYVENYYEEGYSISSK